MDKESFFPFVFFSFRFLNRDTLTGRSEDSDRLKNGQRVVILSFIYFFFFTFFFPSLTVTQEQDAPKIQTVWRMDRVFLFFVFKSNRDTDTGRSQDSDCLKKGHSFVNFVLKV